MLFFLNLVVKPVVYATAMVDSHVERVHLLGLQGRTIALVLA